LSCFGFHAAYTRQQRKKYSVTVSDLLYLLIYVLLHSSVSIGSKCLAHDLSDDIWYRATVVDMLSDAWYHIMFDSNHDERKLEAQDIFPLGKILDEILKRLLHFFSVKFNENRICTLRKIFRAKHDFF
jgi:hypothetical protein